MPKRGQVIRRPTEVTLQPHHWATRRAKNRIPLPTPPALHTVLVNKVLGKFENCTNF